MKKSSHLLWLCSLLCLFLLTPAPARAAEVPEAGQAAAEPPEAELIAREKIPFEKKLAFRDGIQNSMNKRYGVNSVKRAFRHSDLHAETTVEA